MNCDGTENTIEECGGVIELESCPRSCSTGWLQCGKGKQMSITVIYVLHVLM